jgi:hypothetical protein
MIRSKQKMSKEEKQENLLIEAVAAASVRTSHPY